MQDQVGTPVFPAFLFPPISWWKQIVKFSTIHVLENENWVKQSFRNRFEIYGPNNRQRITLPIVGNSKHGSIAEVELDMGHNWAQQSWRSIVTAYNNSPFFEYYKDSIEPLFLQPHRNLLELNMSSVKLCCDLLGLDIKVELISTDYNTIAQNYCGHDYRKHDNQQAYYQVFADRNGFQENLSILDLLFNLGPEAGSYLLRN